MTLDQAISFALQNNELVSENHQAQIKARAKIHDVASNGLPQVKVTVTAVEETKTSANFGGMAIVLSPATSKTGNASLTQLVDIWGSVKRAKNMAVLGNRIAELNVLRSKSEVVYQTRSAYYDVLRALGSVDAAQAAVTDAEEQLKLAEAYVRAGTSPEFDVTRAKVTLADRQQTLISSQDAVNLAGAAFNNVLGRDVNTAVNLAAIADTPTRDVDITAQTQKALESRPEIIQASLGIKANHDAVGISRAGDRPQVALVGGYAYNWTASGLSTQKASWDYGVNVSWPIVDSGATRAKVSEAQADLKTSELQLQQLQRGVAVDVRQSGLKVQETADRFEVADKSVALAEEALRLAKVRYQNGVATQLEVTDAETALTSARFNRVNALYDHLTARAAFDATVLGRM
jgi:outer membrane protein TolC